MTKCLKRVAIGVFLLAAAAAGSATPKQKPARPTFAAEARMPETAQALVKAATAYDKGDCPRAIALARPITGRLDDFKGSEELAQGPILIWEILARCHAEVQDWQQAASDIRHAVALNRASEELWHLQLQYDRRSESWTSLVETLEWRGSERPEMLNRVSMDFLFGVDRELGRAKQKALQARLAATLASDSFRPVEFMAITDGFRLDHAVNLAGAGRMEEARAVATALTVPWTVAQASLHTDLRAFFPADPDLRSLAERMLARDRELMKQHPDRLQPVVAVATELEMLGRPQEALAVLQSVASRVGDPKAFVDRDRQLPWWWDKLSDVYEVLGRYDEAVDALKQGGKLQEYGGLNVSQTINLAHVQVSIGRYNDAIATLAVFDKPGHDISPYGHMAMREARACAFALKGDKAAAAKDIDYMRAHRDDAHSALGNALRCMGDFDAAAEALIARLDDPERRAATLATLSDYDDPPVKLAETPLDRIEAQVKARPDVQAAIKRAGGTRRFNIQEL